MSKTLDIKSGKVLKSVLAFAVIFLALLCIGIQARADEGGYTITNYEFHGVLHENNVMDVTENITVNFTEPRHGIYRYITTYYSLNRDTSENGDGSALRNMSYYATVKNLNVVGAEFSESSDNSDSRTYCVQIGNEDETVTGEKMYQITYQYVMRDDRIPNSDFFFYSVLGAGWQTNIDKFSFTVDFDKEIPESSINGFKVYSGPYGSTGNSLNVVYDVTASGISGSAENIGPNQAISLYTDLPEGYFVGAESTESSVPLLFMIPAVLLAVVLLVLELAKKDKPPVITVEFYPPEGISPAEIGTIVDETVDDEDLLAMIPYWADQGYLLIDVDEQDPGKKGKDKGSVTLSKKKDLPDDAPYYQKELFGALFKDGDTVKLSDLGKDFIKSMDNAKLALNNKYFSGDRKLSTGGFKAGFICILDCLLYGAALSFSSKLDLLDNGSWGRWVFFALAAVCLLRLLMVSKYYILSKTKKIIYCAVMAILVLAAFFISAFKCAGPDSFLTQSISILCFAPVAAAMVLSGNLIHETEYKRSIFGKIIGFRNFIQTAEISRLKILMNDDPEYYYHILPYAMAFELSGQWAKLFKDIKLENPSWYRNHNGYMFNAVYFNHCFVDQMNYTVNTTRGSMSSSSSSGGFSGGGGGGGGGGSW